MTNKHVQRKRYIFNKKIVNVFRILTLILIFTSIFTFKVQADDPNVLAEARKIIKSNYVTEVSDNVLNSSTIEEIVKKLDDPYSQYFSKKQQQNFINIIENKICDIGIYMEQVSDGIKVKGIIPDSPAASTGIKVGDIIVSADEKSLVGATVGRASDCIKGQQNTKVKLIVKRESTQLTFYVPRKEINMPTVEGEMLNSRTAYISISSFGADTSDLFTKKLQQLKDKNPQIYIIDLRNNGGGYMATAVDVAGNFIGANPAIIVEDRQSHKVTYSPDYKGPVIDKPVFFLINKCTASAAEILAAAVKDYKKAFFIGTTTYGKGVAQQTFNLSDGTVLKLTTEKFYSPKGNIINKIGISPDFKVESIDSLSVADLFSCKCENSVDKRGYVRIKVNGENFEINLSVARDENHWSAFKYILSKVSSDGVYIGTEKGWTLATKDYIDNMYKFLYPNCKSNSILKDVPTNKVFNILFNKSIDEKVVRDNINIEIINEKTGKRSAFDIKKTDDKKMDLKPKEELKSGEAYYIKAGNFIKPIVIK